MENINGENFDFKIFSLSSSNQVGKMSGVLPQ